VCACDFVSPSFCSCTSTRGRRALSWSTVHTNTARQRSRCVIVCPSLCASLSLRACQHGLELVDNPHEHFALSVTLSLSLFCSYSLFTHEFLSCSAAREGSANKDRGAGWQQEPDLAEESRRLRLSPSPLLSLSLACFGLSLCLAFVFLALSLLALSWSFSVSLFCCLLLCFLL
jgi:hypothetical protein